jgi:hypothetical protein
LESGRTDNMDLADKIYWCENMIDFIGKLQDAEQLWGTMDQIFKQ